MAKKHKILILSGVVIIVAILSLFAYSKKSKDAKNQQNLQYEMQSKIDLQQTQIDQQKAQIEELIKFKDEQAQSNAVDSGATQETTETGNNKTSSSGAVNNQPTSNTKTNSDSTSAADKSKDQKKCQDEIDKYNFCVYTYNAEMTDYTACLAKYSGEGSNPCMAPSVSCSMPNCNK